LEQYGGHKYAAGLTLSLDKVEPFQDRFEEVVSNSITKDQQIPKLHIEADLPLEYINHKTNSILSQMEPFGPQNMTPIFGTKNVFIRNEPNIIKEEHAKGFLREGNNDKYYEWIAFGLAEKAKEIKPGRPFQIAYQIEENNFMQQKSLILNIKDIRFD
ncbi:MAG: single-stranded-DNA-specific exonuclease RecJ, partial [Bacteroidota bacterium]